MKRHKTTDFYKTYKILKKYFNDGSPGGILSFFFFYFLNVIIVNSMANSSTKSFILYRLQLLGEDVGKGKILTISTYC